jgi:hypothetical protein
VLFDHNKDNHQGAYYHQPHAYTDRLHPLVLRRRQDQLDLHPEEKCNPLDNVAAPSDGLPQLLIVSLVSSFGSAYGRCGIRFDFALEYIEQEKYLSGTLLVFL